MKKYELTNETIQIEGKKLYRIKALIDFGDVKAGDLGGFIEKESNLSHLGNAWIYDDAMVCGNAKVRGNAEVYGNAWVYGNAKVRGNAEVYGNAWIYDDAEVCDDAKVYGNAEVYGNVWIYDDAEVCDDAKVCGNARVCDDAWVYGNAVVCGNARVCDDGDYACVKGFGTEYRNTTFYKQKNGSVGVNCGCFTGTLEEFRNQVKKTRKGKIEKEYLMIADLIEYHFAEEETMYKGMESYKEYALEELRLFQDD